MEEKILLLKDHLPEFMVKNRRMYNILGKGLHELTKDECRAFFDTLRLGIEVILDERMAEQRRKQKVAAAEKGLGEIKPEDLGREGAVTGKCRPGSSF